MTTFRQHIPAWSKRGLRIAIYGLLDAWDKVTGRREAMIPPRMTSLIVGSGNFKKTGLEFREHLIRHAGLTAGHRVLEIGAGYGRMAVGLTGFLAAPGSYDGIEIISKAVNWCNQEIGSRFPNFRFHHADVSNPYSNPDGRNQSTEYRLPFDAGSFDVVFLTSVFSHMLPKDIDAYLGEISRVLRLGGSCFITYYLLNDYSLAQIRDHKASQPFYHSFDGYLSTSKDTPENTIAVPEDTMREVYRSHGLTVEDPVLYGAWPGRDQFLSYQDVIVARKNAGTTSSVDATT